MKNKVKTVIGILMMITMMFVSEKTYVFIVYIFAAILHESGHLITTKVLKMKTEEIYFDFSGVRIVVDNNTTSYSSELILALAGPITNIIFACIAAHILVNTTSFSDIILQTESFLSTGSPSLTGILGFFILASFVQAGINLLPIKSFDGGRALYCFLSSVFNDNLALHVISVTSSIFTFLLWSSSLYLMIRISSGLGIFVFSASIFALMLSDTDFYESR